MNIVIIGNSAAGLSALQNFRKVDKDSKVVMISKEGFLPYSRVLLPYVLRGKLPNEGMTIRTQDYFERLHAECVEGTVTKLDAQAHKVFLEDGRSFDYDKLLIATGSYALTPPIEGAHQEGVCNMWTKADVDKLMPKFQNSKRAVVIGSGFVALQAAWAACYISSAVQKYNESRTKAFRMLCNEQESLWSREAEQLVAQMKMDKFCGVVCWNCRTGELGEDQMDRCRQTVERMREIRQGEILRVVRKNDVIFSVNGASLERCQELCGRVQECTPDFCRFTCLHSPQEQKRLLDVWRNRYHFDFQDSENQSNMVRIVKRYIREHLAENILLGDMAQLVYVHPTYLSKLFKKETQQNLSDYITQCRMERAKQLLKRPEYKIYEVAEACGFQDAKHFALVFKSYVGCTPRQYRNEG